LASQILHERVLFLTNFVQRYGFFQYVVSNGAIFLKPNGPKGAETFASLRALHIMT
jgi:hypothetical protein